MDLFCHEKNVSVRTDFNDKYELIQIFRDVNPDMLDFMTPTDFSSAGIQRKGRVDPWHFEIPFAVSTDECPPQQVAGEWLGGNHAAPFCVSVKLKDHNKTYADIGSLWRDNSGVLWTLLGVHKNSLTFMSENLGTREDYKFSDNIDTSLTFVENGRNRDDIVFESQYRDGIKPIVSFNKKEVIAIMPSGEEIVNASAMGCKEVVICEEYDILNPATLCEWVRKNRPADGYTSPLLRINADAMINCKIKYKVLNDGTVLSIFNNTALENVNYGLCMGIMYQEKCDFMGKGIYRYIPKVLPFECDGYTYDFTVPFNTSERNCPNFFVTKDYWADKNSPPDRQLDFIKDSDNTNAVVFAGGYLPVLDGHPDIRKNNLKFSNQIIRTNKTYPTFASKDYLKQISGVAYRKYFFNPSSKSTVYDISFDGIKYVFVDFFEFDTVTINTDGKKTEIYEKSDCLTINSTDKALTISANKGFAVIKIFEE